MAQQNPLHPLTLSRRNIGNFRANYDYQNSVSGGINMSARDFGTGNSVYLLRANNPVYATRIMHTALVECNAADTGVQQSAYYMSVIIAVFPGLYDMTVLMFEDTGYSVETLNEDTMSAAAIELKDWIDTPTALTIFGQMALVMYKHIDARSYQRFMTNRTEALKAEAGMHGSLIEGSPDVLLRIDVAKAIRTIAGGSSLIRAGLLRMILYNRNGEQRRNRVCNYLAEIISWTEMSTIVFIFEGLCLTASPVLKDHRVRHEMNNLAIAFDRINATEQPQYYRIFKPTEAGVTIVKSRFPTLAEVARRYCTSRSTAVEQFAQNTQTASLLVDQLLAKHQAYMARQTETRDLNAFRYLTEVNFVQEEEVVAAAAE